MSAMCVYLRILIYLKRLPFQWLKLLSPAVRFSHGYDSERHESVVVEFWYAGEQLVPARAERHHTATSSVLSARYSCAVGHFAHPSHDTSFRRLSFMPCWPSFWVAFLEPVVNGSNLSISGL